MFYVRRQTVMISFQRVVDQLEARVGAVALVVPERTCHSKHVSLVFWTEFHVVHKVLKTDLI